MIIVQYCVNNFTIVQTYYCLRKQDKRINIGFERQLWIWRTEILMLWNSKGIKWTFFPFIEFFYVCGIFHIYLRSIVKILLKSSCLIAQGLASWPWNPGDWSDVQSSGLLANAVDRLVISWILVTKYANLLNSCISLSNWVSPFLSQT